MKYSHSMPLWHTNAELLPGGGPTRVVLSSIDTRWNGVVMEQHEFPSIELADVMFKRHVIVINSSRSITGEFKKEGGFSTASRQEARFPSSRAISLFFSG